MVVSIAMLAVVAPWVPFNHAPDTPLARSQVDGTSRGIAPALKVAVADPDRDPIDVTFFGREVVSSTPVEEPFTVVVVPDPQKYVSTVELSATYRAQMRWIVASRQTLGTEFVVAVGDLVQRDESITQWKRANRAWQILDRFRVPYSVVPGNHDMAAGGGAELYDRLFPPERYEATPWYGGYLGDPTDGIPDPADRGNKDSYQLFTAAGSDFLVLNLEMDLPVAAVRWADDVIDAFPDRHVILVTHRWMDREGVRWRGPLYRRDVPVVSPERAWRDLVVPNCSVFMVIAGHDYGEAHRQDENACGEPVFQLLTDYQDRPNGGDGWLRYYTFRPEEATIEATTFSVTRSGARAYERDADSRFALPWRASDPGFTRIGVAQDVPSGGVASIRWRGLEPGRTYEWYAAATDGTLVHIGEPTTFMAGHAGGR